MKAFLADGGRSSPATRPQQCNARSSASAHGPQTQELQIHAVLDIHQSVAMAQGVPRDAPRQPQAPAKALHLEREPSASAGFCCLAAQLMLGALGSITSKSDISNLTGAAWPWRTHFLRPSGAR